MREQHTRTKLMTALIALAAVLLLSLATSGVTCRPPGSGEPAVTPTPPELTPTPPPQPQLRVIKISGSGEKNKFRVKLKWDGEGTTIWKIKRWTVMRDLTNQTQSMLVINEQAFEIEPGEPRLIFVLAVCINPELPAARQLLVDYPGAPRYVLTDEIPNPRVQTLVEAIGKVEAGIEAMRPRLRFRRNTVELTRPQPGEEAYLQVVVWDQSVTPPRPYLEENVIEAAVVVAAAGGMTLADYSIHLQKTIPGADAGETLSLATQIQDRVNKLLALAGLSERLRKR